MERYEMTKGAVPITAAAALYANLFVGYDGNPCAANAKALGVPIFDSAPGDVAAVYTAGNIIPVIAGAAVTVGAPVASDASSRAVPAPPLGVAAGATGVQSTAANGSILSGGAPPVAINGYALDAAAQAGALIRVLLV